MRVGCSRHGDRVSVVLQAVGGLVLYRAPRRLLAHSGLETTALNHEPVYDTVKDRVRVEAGFDVGEEVLRRLRSLRRVELERDDAVVRVQFDHEAICPTSRTR